MLSILYSIDIAVCGWIPAGLLACLLLYIDLYRFLGEILSLEISCFPCWGVLVGLVKMRGFEVGREANIQLGKVSPTKWWVQQKRSFSLGSMLVYLAELSWILNLELLTMRPHDLRLAQEIVSHVINCLTISNWTRLVVGNTYPTPNSYDPSRTTRQYDTDGPWWTKEQHPSTFSALLYIEKNIMFCLDTQSPRV